MRLDLQHGRFRFPAVATVLALLAALCGATAAHAAGGTTYYVSSSTGDDSADGTSPSTPWQSLAKVDATGLNPGDSVLFKAGDSWSGQLVPNGSGDSAAVITFGAYGTGVRPRIDGNGVQPATVLMTTQQYLDITGLEITNNAGQRAVRSGILVNNTTTSPLTHIHLTNLSIHNVYGISYGDGNPGWSDPGDGAIIVTGRGDSATSRVDDLLIDTVAIDTVDDAGVRIQPLNGSARASGVVVRNVSVNNSGGNGLMVGGTTNALIEHNKVTNGGSRSTASAGIWGVHSNGSVFQYNEVSGETTLSADGYAYDMDWDQTGVVYQYNLSHDNAVGAFEFFPSGTGTLRYNISQNDGISFKFYNNISGAKNYSVYNNTVYRGPGTTAPVVSNDVGSSLTATFSNNIIYDLGSGSYDSGGTWVGNVFYGNHQPSEPNDSSKITSDPLLVSPGTATSLADASGYQLRSGSPAIGSGVLISGNGGLDYFGNAVSSSAAPNRGAFNGTPVSGGAVVDDSAMGSGVGQVNYVGAWGHCNPCSGDPAQPPLYNSSNSWSNTAGNTATVAFIGTGIQVYAVTDTNEGIATVSVDGGTATNIDLYSSTRNGNQGVWTSPVLPSGNHVLTVAVTGTKNSSASGVYVSLDRFQVTNVLTVDDTVTGSGQNQIAYAGAWGSCSPCNGDPASPALYNQSNHWSNGTNNTAVLAFTGTQVRLFAVTDTNGGIAAVSVDGGAETPVDLYGSSRVGNSPVWASPTLSPGSHTVAVRVTGTKNPSATNSYVCLDRVDIYS